MSPRSIAVANGGSRQVRRGAAKRDRVRAAGAGDPNCYHGRSVNWRSRDDLTVPIRCKDFRSIAGDRGAKFGAPFHGVNPATGERLEPAFYEASVGGARPRVCRGGFSVRGVRATAHGARARMALLRPSPTGSKRMTKSSPAASSRPVSRRRGSQASGPALAVNCDCLRRSGRRQLGGRADRPSRIPIASHSRSRTSARCGGPLGPVAVFCASNFPLAFSVAGGDTASALAAGCPVVVKAHHAHPGVAELVGGAVVAAVPRASCRPASSRCFMAPAEPSDRRGEAIRALRRSASPGSRGGQSLMKAAAAGLEPIPVYAEMSSVNPMFLLPRDAPR